VQTLDPQDRQKQPHLKYFFYLIKKMSQYEQSVENEAGQAQATLSGFEGPEKLLEIWFKKSNPLSKRKRQDSELTLHADIDWTSEGFDRTGLRTVDPKYWKEMLAIVNCQVLSTLKNEHADAYLLSESSMFVYSHRLTLKTCGTTKLLHAVEKILEIAAYHCKLTDLEAIFYSRKSFLFPERQEFPHGSWTDEVNYLNGIFPDTKFDTAGYVIGNITGDHWNLYLATPLNEPVRRAVGETVTGNDDDVTLEILMTELDPQAMAQFWRTEQEKLEGSLPHNVGATKHELSNPRRIFESTKMNGIYPRSIIDDYVFDPCGYSANGLMGPYYYTIHVTPEDICSYASFETCVPVKSFKQVAEHAADEYNNFTELIQKVVNIFKPGKFSTTLFVRHNMKRQLDEVMSRDNVAGFVHRDRITHSLGKWELMFSHYERQP
jgi:S-adenosylmethionine decarboxylase